MHVTISKSFKNCIVFSFFLFKISLEMCELNKSELGKVTTFVKFLKLSSTANSFEDIFEISSSFEELFKETKIYFSRKNLCSLKKFRLLGIFFLRNTI